MLSATVVLVFFVFLYQESRGDVIRKPTQELHHRMTEREVEKIFGVNSKSEVPEYEVVSPLQADAAGDTISSELHHHRRKRDLDGSDVMFYKLNAFGVPMHLKVNRNTQFLGPNFHVETRHADGRREFVQKEMTAKHYLGQEMNDPSSMVALTSDKSGLTGMLQLSDSAYYMHPLPAHLAKHYQDDQGGHPHVFYKHSLQTPDIEEDYEDSPASKTEINQNAKETISMEDDVIIPAKKYTYDENIQDQNDESSQLPNLELILMADSSTLAFHGRDFIPDYFAVLANIVHGIFKDSSIGEKKINIVLVKAVIVTNEELKIQNNFTSKTKVIAAGRWLEENRDNLGTTVDTISLISKSTSGGLAKGSSICWLSSSNICSDKGLQTVGIIAHETAHNLGIGHDGYKKDCPNYKNIMSTSIPGGALSLKWSNCSREQFVAFFKTGLKCLANQPTSHAAEMPDEWKGKYPGVLFDPDKQCKLQNGNTSTSCAFLTSTCRSLYCLSSNGYSCWGNGAAPMDGSVCGPRHWCMSGKCVDNGAPLINGQWSPWEQATSCSKSCGGGVTFRTRKCNNPLPANGGAQCEGSTKGGYEICNPQDCPDKISDRREQCRNIKETLREHYYGGSCNLWCKKEGASMTSGHGPAKDGSRCYSDILIKDICIKGQCRSVGCDNKIESGAVKDRCGVCNGDGSACELVTGTFTDNYREWGVNKGTVMFVAPAGSTQILVKKSKAGVTNNMLGVKRPDQAVGKRLIGLPCWGRTINYAGTKIIYYHNEYRDRESITVAGPTTEPLAFEFIYISSYNHGIDYRYFKNLSTPNPTQDSDFKWQINGNWTQCTKSCAGGISTREVLCLRVDDTSIVSDYACKNHAKPEHEKPCNSQPCPAEWYTAEWTPCSKSCATGEQTREQKCRHLVSENTHEDAPLNLCSGPKPETTLKQICNVIDCPLNFRPLAWGECSTSCGSGFRARKLQCHQITKDGIDLSLGDFACRHVPVKPVTEEICNEENPCEPPEKFSVGCFNDDRKEPHPMPELLADFSQMSDNDPSAIVRQCNMKATERGYTFFAIRGKGVCVSGANAEKTYFIDWTNEGENRCTSGLGRADSIAVYTTEPMPAYVEKGCYGDASPRGLEKYLANMRPQIIWTAMKHTVHQCARLASAQNYKYFSVQYYGECWASNQETYAIHGKSTNCYDGTGGGYTNFVYQLM